MTAHAAVFNLLAAAALLLAAPQRVAAQVPPDEAWRTVETEHFRVTFPAELEALGRRAALLAEHAYLELEDAFVEPPDGPIDIVLTDHVDVSNGFAQYFPSNRITIYARPPVDDHSLGFFDDWLELVITHELTHVVHLDRTGTALGKVARGIFGRVNAPYPFFPGVGVPRWVIEGIATWYESALTHAGRTHGTFMEMVLRTAALEGRFEDIGQAGGASPLWPGGTRQYAYGSLFFDYLLEKYGRERMARFVEAVAGQWVPYRLDAAGEEAFGVPLSREWEAWAETIRREVERLDDRLRALGPITEPERLTQGARWGLEPAVSPDGRHLVYVRADARSDQQLVIARPDGTDARTLTRTNQLATFDFLPDGRVLFAQLEYADRYRIYSDLYVVDTLGQARRVTRGARLSQPTVGPDPDYAVAVAEGGGSTALVRVRLQDGAVDTLVASRMGVDWAYPQISPDGRWIAASRWREGGYHDVVILDAAGRLVHEVTGDRALDLAPDWSPDGRWLVWASDRTGILNILGAPVDEGGRTGPVRLLTNVRTGVSYPSVHPDGSWLYFSGYHVDGWEVERTAFRPEDAPLAPEPDPRFADDAGDAAGLGGVEEALAADVEVSEVKPYSPWPTLLPTYWEPVLREPVESREVRTDDVFIPRRELLGYAVGAQTGGLDLVGRHAWGAIARVFTSGGKAEGGVTYSFAGLGNPVLGITATQRWDEEGPRLGRRSEDAPLDTLYVLERERSVFASASFSRPTWRRAMALTFTGGLTWEHGELLDHDLSPSTAYRLTRPDSRLADFTASIHISTARTYSFQLGGARGASLFVRGRVRRELSLPDSLAGAEGRDRSSDDVIGSLRAFVPLGGPGFASTVLAFRGAFGAARGPDATAGFYDVGGAAGRAETVTGLSLFGGVPLFFPVRGYPRSARFGRYAWTTALELRVPLALLNRGLGAWPLHLDRVFGSLFFDAGNAWGPDVQANGFRNPLRRALMSVGAELTTETLTFYRAGLRLRAGVAQPLVEGGGTRVYLRVGLPF